MIYCQFERVDAENITCKMCLRHLKYKGNDLTKVHARCKAFPRTEPRRVGCRKCGSQLNIPTGEIEAKQEHQEPKPKLH